MAVAKVGGYTDYSSASASQYTAQYFSLTALKRYYDALILSDISNTDYIGEITGKGDKITIRTIPDVTISPYNKGEQINFENVASTAVTLTIDFADKFAFELNDIDIHNMDMDWMAKFAENAGIRLKIAAETIVFANAIAQIDASNKGNTAGRVTAAYDMGVAATPLIVNKANIIDTITDMGSILDEQNVPPGDRYVILPPHIIGLLKKSDLKNVSITGDGVSPIRNGLIGEIDGFKIYSSNILPKNGSVDSNGASLGIGTNGYACLFGHKDALAFASTIDKVEQIRLPSGFEEAMKGLHVYGFKVVQPKLMGVAFLATK